MKQGSKVAALTNTPPLSRLLYGLGQNEHCKPSDAAEPMTQRHHGLGGCEQRQTTPCARIGLCSKSARKLAAVEQIALRLVEIENLHALLSC